MYPSPFLVKNTQRYLLTRNIIEMNKKIFCEKCHKWHTITITDGEKFAICPNKRCGHLVFIQERK